MVYPTGPSLGSVVAWDIHILYCPSTSPKFPLAISDTVKSPAEKCKLNYVQRQATDLYTFERCFYYAQWHLDQPDNICISLFTAHYSVCVHTHQWDRDTYKRQHKEYGAVCLHVVSSSNETLHDLLTTCNSYIYI